nr:ribonuclease H [Tanacetum cinerariifolium]
MVLVVWPNCTSGPPSFKIAKNASVAKVCDGGIRWRIVAGKSGGGGEASRSKPLALVSIYTMPSLDEKHVLDGLDQRILQALYRLKQAPRAWYDLLSKFLPSQHFVKGAVDLTLFTWKEGEHIILIPLYCDSQSIIALSCNTVQHSRTKHIAVRYHFINGQFKNEIVKLYFVKTTYQLANIFTKALARERFDFLVKCLGMQSIMLEELKLLIELDEDEE